MSVCIYCAVRKNEPAPFAGPEHSYDFIKQEFADQFGSLSSPDFSSTLQAIAKYCSTRSVSVIAEETEPRPIRSSTSSGRRLEACWPAARSAKEKAWGPRSKDREHTPRLQLRRQFLTDSGG